jgi:hypothetical protein
VPATLSTSGSGRQVGGGWWVAERDACSSGGAGRSQSKEVWQAAPPWRHGRAAAAREKRDAQLQARIIGGEAGGQAGGAQQLAASRAARRRPRRGAPHGKSVQRRILEQLCT